MAHSPPLRRMLRILPDAATICESQFYTLYSNGFAPVAVLWDSKNDPPSPDIYKGLRKYAKDNYGNPDLVCGSDIAGDLSNITSAFLLGDPLNNNIGFMLIPSALFYNNVKKITDAVKNAPNIQEAIYPEREYKKAHKTAKLHGHNIPLTFRWAASYVASLLDDPTCISGLPWQEAIKDG